MIAHSEHEEPHSTEAMRLAVVSYLDGIATMVHELRAYSSRIDEVRSAITLASPQMDGGGGSSYDRIGSGIALMDALSDRLDGALRRYCDDVEAAVAVCSSAGMGGMMLYAHHAERKPWRVVAREYALSESRAKALAYEAVPAVYSAMPEAAKRGAFPDATD